MDLMACVQMSVLQMRSSVLRHGSKHERDILAFNGHQNS